MSYLHNDWASGLRTWAKRSIAPVLESESANSLPGVQHDYRVGKAYSYASGKGFREVPDIPEGLWLIF